MISEVEPIVTRYCARRHRKTAGKCRRGDADHGDRRRPASAFTSRTAVLEQDLAVYRAAAEGSDRV